jgi:hypothetical protein
MARWLYCIGFGAAFGTLLALGGMYVALLYGPDNLVSI